VFAWIVPPADLRGCEENPQHFWIAARRPERKAVEPAEHQQACKERVEQVEGGCPEQQRQEEESPVNTGDGDRTVIIAGGVGDATSQATLQVMNRFLNRLPTITIREGHRVKVYLTSDVELPAYVAPRLPSQF
jgi:hypothetical protein